MNKAVAAFFAIMPLLVYVIIIGYGGLLANLHISNPIADVFAQSIGAAFFSFIIIIASVLTTYFATRATSEGSSLASYAQPQPHPDSDYVVASPEQVRQAMMRRRISTTPTTTVPPSQPKFKPYRPAVIAEQPRMIPAPDPSSIPPELVTDLNKFGIDAIIMWDKKRQNVALLQMTDGTTKVAEFVTDLNNSKNYPDVQLVAIFEITDGKLHLKDLQEVVR